MGTGRAEGGDLQVAGTRALRHGERREEVSREGRKS